MEFTKYPTFRAWLADKPAREKADALRLARRVGSMAITTAYHMLADQPDSLQTFMSRDLGIFSHPDKEGVGRLTGFFNGILGANIALVAHYSQRVNDGQPFSDLTALSQTVRTKSLNRLSSSVSDFLAQEQLRVDEISKLPLMLSQILNPPKNSEFSKKNPYTIHSRAILYVPHNQRLDQHIFYPAQKYKFQVPADVQFDIFDLKSKHLLRISLFPISYSKYDRHKELEGLPPEAAKEVLMDRYHNMEKYQKVAEIVSSAVSTARAAGLKLVLFDDNGKCISQISGLLNEFEDTGKGKYIGGFKVFSSDMPPHTVFAKMYERPLKPSKGQAPTVPFMQQLTQDFLGLGIKNR